MIRQNIILGEHPYIVDLYKHGTDKEAMLSKEWCMLRGLDVMNGVAYDSDIYFVEKDILSDVCENFNADNQIVFPVPNSKGNLFSTEYTDFNSNFSEWGFHIGGQDVYDIYKKQKVYDSGDALKRYKITISEKNVVSSELIPMMAANLTLQMKNPQTYGSGIVIDDYSGNIVYPVCKTWEEADEVMEKFQQMMNELLSGGNNFKMLMLDVTELINNGLVFNLTDMFGEEAMWVGILSPFLPMQAITEDMPMRCMAIVFLKDVGDFYLDILPMDEEQPYSFSEDMVPKQSMTPDYDDPDGVVYVPFDKFEESGSVVIALSPIKCDTLRIYHPHTKVDLPYIIYVDSYVNNIHLHFFCRRNDKLPTFTENEFAVENILYSEFFEVSIPNFEDLFAKDTYFKENLNIVSLEEAYMTVTATGEDTDGVTITDTVNTPAGKQEVEVSCEPNKVTKIVKVPTDSEYSGLISQNGLETFVSMYLLTLPFKIEPIDNAGHHKKVFLTETSSSNENNYISYPITVTLFPYSGINDSLNTYQASDKYDANSDVFTQELKFMLSSTMGFNHGVISVISKFLYPNSENFNSFREAYEFYNNVSFDDYEDIIESDEEYADGEVIKKQCGFEIEIASDVEFTQIIYKNYFEANEADDFAFRLDNIFDSWANMPELLICRVRFIDRYVGISIYGNQVVITKEWFKYLVNDSARHRIHEVLPTQPQWGYCYRIKSQKQLLWDLI